MLERAGLGFVMGNADPELLALGLPALPTNDEDGVARAIEEHVLRGREPEEAGGGSRGATRLGATGCERPDTRRERGLRGARPKKKWGARSLSTPPNFPGALTSSSWRPSSWQPSSSPALR